MVARRWLQVATKGEHAMALDDRLHRGPGSRPQRIGRPKASCPDVYGEYARIRPFDSVGSEPSRRPWPPSNRRHATAIGVADSMFFNDNPPASCSGDRPFSFASRVTGTK